MQTIFPIETAYPQGFRYTGNFITEKEEDDLQKIIAGISLHTFQFQGYAAKRKVASFGYDWSFDQQELIKGKAIPAEFDWLIRRVADFLPVAPADFAELLVTEYPVGSVINWHRDAPPFDIIAGISLNSDCIFKLRPHEKEKQTRKSVVSLPVQRRSLYVMQGPARIDWQHSMAPVEKLRYSITLRTLKPRFDSPVQRENNLTK